METCDFGDSFIPGPALRDKQMLNHSLFEELLHTRGT